MTTFNIGHVTLNVTDIQQSKQFYQREIPLVLFKGVIPK